MTLTQQVVALQGTVASLEARLSALEAPRIDVYTPIIDAVCAEYRVTPDRLVGTSRLSTFVRARHAAIFLCHEARPDKLDLAHRFARTSAALNHAIESVRELLTWDHKFQAQMARIRSAIDAAMHGPQSGTPSNA
jgi:chromosomal replication initiation ATPase DnaA